MKINISICLASVRPWLWKDFLESLYSNSINIEVIFVGDKLSNNIYTLPPNIEIVPIYSTVKPAQAYQGAFNIARGELIHWSSDEAIYLPYSIDNMYKFHKNLNIYKLITAFTVKENNGETFSKTSDGHYIGNKDTPRMACFGVINKAFMKQLGGFDRRFIAGQGENDLCMRCLERMGEIKFNKDSTVEVYHNKVNHNESLFRRWYPESRRFLERCWFSAGGKLSNSRLIPFEPFNNKDIFLKTQEPYGDWK